VGAIIEKLEELEQPPVIRNSRLAIGLFADTLPTLTSRLLTTSVWCILTQTYIQLHRNSPQACGAGRICGHAATRCSTSGTDSTAPGPMCMSSALGVCSMTVPASDGLSPVTVSSNGQFGLRR
jgi:hypothetical protein